MNTKDRILDIAMNLNRVGNWAADDYKIKQQKIKLFLENTSDYLNLIDKKKLNISFKKTYVRFISEFAGLKREGIAGPVNPLYWGEQMMTWGNILTHRSNLL